MEEKKQDQKEKKNWFFELLPYIVILLLVIVIKTYFISPILVNGESMEPTLKDHDLMILNKFYYRNHEIKRFDIVVIYLEEENEFLIKRVIGLPGEKIEYKNNKLYVNGKYVKENFKHMKTKDFTTKDISYEEIPDNKYLVLGDNRTNSIDSRILGYINEKDIEGKTSLIIFPFNRIGTKK